MQKVKNNILWISLTAVALLIVGTLVVGNATARADGGTCKVKILDKCIVDWANELKDVQDELNQSGLGDNEPSFSAFVGP